MFSHIIMTDVGMVTPSPSVCKKIESIPTRKNGRFDRRFAVACRLGPVIDRYERIIRTVAFQRWLDGAD